MGGHRTGANALLFGVSVVALSAFASTAAKSQTVLDTITVLATKTEENVWDTLANVTSMRTDEIERRMPSKTSDLFLGMPSVWMEERGDTPETAISIRGLQDFGRVAVIIDGARQNFQRSGHNANGTFFLEPELLSGLDIIRGPVANIYGSGAIGGVASFRTKDVEDILLPGERYGTEINAGFGSNQGQGLGSAFGAARVGPNVDIFAGGTYRSQSNYEDGNGHEVVNTGKDVGTGIAKLTVRPADGHELKFSGLHYDARYQSGQQIPQGESVYDSHAINQIVSARWTYNRPDDRLFDFDGQVYWTRTALDQTKIANGDPVTLGNPITGFIGDSRSYNIDTTGFDLHNTTRFDTGAFHHALTYGGDFFTDKVDNFDPTGSAAVVTPNGDRTVWGSFAQLKTEYSTWLEIISGIRYDNYALEGAGFASSGEHWSPKVTVGITPVAGFQVYGTFAEGYRAPAVTETLVTGLHPAVGTTGQAGPFGPNSIFVYNPLFTFLPNPQLRPEIGQTKEVGVNLKYDNIFRPGDTFRGKIAVFQNDVEDFIEAVNFGPPNPIVQVCPFVPVGCPPIPLVTFATNPYSFTQYQNIGNARIRGIEADLNYDAGDWFVGLAGQHLEGEDRDTGQPLRSIQPDQIATTLGFRFYDRRLTVGARWIAVADKDADDIPDRNNDSLPDVLPSESYNLINVFLAYEPTPDVIATFGIDNILDEYYVPYLSAEQVGSDGTPGIIFPGPGRTFKGALRIRFGAS